MSKPRKTALASIREFWPVVRTLRREGMSWRQLPEHMHRYFAIPLVSHAVYIKVAHEQGDLRERT